MIRPLLVTISMLCLTTGTMADDGKIDGTTVRRITFDGDQVTIEYNNGSQTTADMADIVIDLSGTSGMKSPSPAPSPNREGKVYDLKGQEVAGGERQTSQGSLRPGMYLIDGKKVIIKQGGKAK